MSMPVQFGPSWAISDHASNVISKYLGPKRNYFSTPEQTSPNHPLPRLLEVEISHWHIPTPNRRSCIAPKKTQIARLQALNIKKSSGTQKIKMLSTFSLLSSPALSMNHSCSALLQGQMNCPAPGWGPALQGFRREAQHDCPAMGWGSRSETEGVCLWGLCFLSAEFIQPSGCHSRLGAGE